MRTTNKTFFRRYERAVDRLNCALNAEAGLKSIVSALKIELNFNRRQKALAAKAVEKNRVLERFISDLTVVRLNRCRFEAQTEEARRRFCMALTRDIAELGQSKEVQRYLNLMFWAMRLTGVQSHTLSSDPQSAAFNIDNLKKCFDNGEKNSLKGIGFEQIFIRFNEANEQLEKLTN